MNLTRVLLYQRLLTYTLVALLASAMGFPFISLKAQAQGFGKPAGSSRSGGVRSGVRGGCFAADRERPLTALVDETNPALTAQGHPTFLFYIPYTQTSHLSPDGKVFKTTMAEFDLRDENDDSVLKNQKLVFLLPEKPGIVKVKLPNTETVLESGKEYFWIFRIICDPNDNSANPSVAGWIKRVKVGSSPEVWFDRLEQFVESPTNHLEQWTQLLNKFQLGDLAGQDIVELKPEQESSTRNSDNTVQSPNSLRKFTP